MTTGGARRGRRDNGLDAADYAVAGDVDPRVGEHLLDVLAAGGIAAYLQPTADLNPILRATTLPARPIDRLYVDRTRLETAREHLQKVTGGALPTPPSAPAADTRPQAEVDAEWEKIIAGFHTLDDSASSPWPEAESVGPVDPPQPTGRPVGEDGRPLNRRRTDPPPPEEQSLLYGLDTFGTDVPESGDDEEERYIPPPPPPLPHISKYAVMGVLSIVVGFVLFLFPQLLPLDKTYVTLFGFAGIVGGAVTLVWRLRSGDDDDEFDDGAVV
ncbi:hypothetical protein AMIS_14470 [Actinoplanes missouriensis 431]|uniref:DUF308 domain-containing protein n=1 Tax=Actinoplanes missouriensis (strain ATCC 14538 / DSM 43046 / CBS 188.64 / JCM 3121 / NBRC 102363 / NCIMB 12654 / NRRL B-3342 / UNCC 431) TaxID=512565 RepID=I0H0Y0_ACTM4|nr:hypothetical protein [Actinoplanes missouriensis]BAL86667.1 hypothetical protein AMIS_14470 [Actinoplanes missouriensis 431]